MINQLLYGDNLEVMKKLPSESFDLIYLDPPFNSNRNYNFLYSQATGLPLPEEAEAFCDAWNWDAEKAKLLAESEESLIHGGFDDEFISFWKNWINTLEKSDKKLLAYMVFMMPRLVEMKRLLRRTGSIYLHCDPTASHYLKILLDAIFGRKNFRNEIVWCYKKWATAKKHFCRNHDVVFCYAKNKDLNFFNIIYQNRAESTMKRFGNKTIHSGAKDEKGKRVPSITLNEDSVGVKMGDWWEIPIIAPSSKERLGYPTQKPLALLDRIIKASCPENGVIFDPFCGCGTTVISAQNNKRNWIGIDICMLAVNSMEVRLKGLFPNLEKGKDYRIDGIPTNAEQAIILARSSNKTQNEGRYQFQYWAIEKVGGFASTKKSSDGGIDGSIYFYKDAESRSLGKMIISVKSDKDLKISYIRDLVGTLSNDKGAEMAGLICIDEPTEGMKQEVLKAGFYEQKFMESKQFFQKIQLLTIKDIFEGKKFQTPFQVEKKIARHSENKPKKEKNKEFLFENFK